MEEIYGKDLLGKALHINDCVAFCKGNQMRIGHVAKLTASFVIIIEDCSKMKCQVDYLRVLKYNL